MSRRGAKPLQMYKHLIDELVRRREEGYGDWITKARWPKTNPQNARINALLAELRPRQRKVVAEIAQRTRDAAIHDVLFVLHERQYFDNLRLVQSGMELPVMPFGTEMYYDWVSRVAGDAWPAEQSARKKRARPNSALSTDASRSRLRRARAAIKRGR